MNADPARAKTSFRYAEAALFASCVALGCIAALRLGQDANWDLQNYHFYDAWAWLRHRSLNWDIAAAQVQTFHNPLPDVPFGLLVIANADPRLITAWLALPTGVAAYFAIKVGWLMFADLRLPERIGATGAGAAIGFTGAMGIGQLGSTTDEWLVTAFTLAALWLLLRGIGSGSAPRSAWPFVLAGVLMGLASGLKLTAATYAVGLCAAMILKRRLVASDMRAAACYCIGVAGGIGAALGPWSWQLWTHFQNPLFPYANSWIHSPWWDVAPVLSRRFGPHSIGDALLLPFKLLAPAPGFVSEIPYVDARIPLLAMLALVGAMGWLISRKRARTNGLPAAFSSTSARWRFAATAFVASFVVWASLHSILRYAIPLEILSGILIIGLFGWLLRPPHATAAIACALAALGATTVWSDGGRVAFGRTWFDVRVPPIESNALVLLTVDAPISYVLPYFPEDARHVGIRNNVNDPARHNRLAASVDEVITGHRGALYALSFPKGQGEADLLAHGLRRVEGGCADVATNMPTSPIELCRLRRINVIAN